MSALLVLPEDRIAREIERWQQINAGPFAFGYGFRMRESGIWN